MAELIVPFFFERVKNETCAGILRKNHSSFVFSFELKKEFDDESAFVHELYIYIYIYI